MFVLTSEYKKLEKLAKELKSSLRAEEKVNEEIQIQLDNLLEENEILKKNLQVSNFKQEIMAILKGNYSLVTSKELELFNLYEAEQLVIMKNKHELMLSLEADINKFESKYLNFEDLDELKWDELTGKLRNSKFGELFIALFQILEQDEKRRKENAVSSIAKLHTLLSLIKKANA